MAAGKTLNAANLEALGAARLAALLLEISAGDAAAKRRLRLALAGNAGAAEVAREVAKRLASISRAGTFLESAAIKSFAADLEAQRRAILDLIAPADPREAFELIWRFVDCAHSVLSRCDDSNGRLSGIFYEAAQALGPLAEAANPDPEELARRVFQALCDDQHDVWQHVIPVLAPALGEPGLAVLKALMLAWQAEPVIIPPERERRVIGWSTSGKLYADQMDQHHRKYVTKAALQQIADVTGDIDAYIAQFDAKARTLPSVAGMIAQRLLAAGRADDAWKTLQAVDPALRERAEWGAAHLDTLEALGRSEQAQAFRLQRFHATLDETQLRAYLRKLPDFEDFDAEQQALEHVLADSHVHHALAFLVGWPDLQRAGRLVLEKTAELDGNLYEVLAPAAEALDDKHPLAATLLRRAMIDFTLDNVRTSRYKHAARHLYVCRSLAQRVSDFGGAPDHVAYERALRKTHERKSAFWQEVEAVG